jgi:hypothetical protein
MKSLLKIIVYIPRSVPVLSQLKFYKFIVKLRKNKWRQTSNRHAKPVLWGENTVIKSKTLISKSARLYGAERLRWTGHIARKEKEVGVLSNF